MGEIPRQQLVLWALAIAAVGLIGARYIADRGEDAGAPPAAAAPVRVTHGGGSGGAYVHVAGAVRRPGVYRISTAARLDSAIRRAGGPTTRADLEGVNLAAKVADGQQVIVPRRVPGTGGAAGMAGGAATGGDTPVSLNTATAEQLDQLDGVGPATAQKILDWRKEHGGFSSVDQLKQISGIGPKRFETLRDSVRM
jgi:competence protein ComEA